MALLDAVRRAETADDDDTRLTALRVAARAYRGDFAAGHDRPWAAEHANRYREMVLDVLDQ
ncbi:MAG: hypothetical protein ACRDQW_00840, partial [Haloechinothrix sp.]